MMQRKVNRGKGELEQMDQRHAVFHQQLAQLQITPEDEDKILYMEEYISKVWVDRRRSADVTTPVPAALPATKSTKKRGGVAQASPANSGAPAQAAPAQQQAQAPASGGDDDFKHLRELGTRVFEVDLEQYKAPATSRPSRAATIASTPSDAAAAAPGAGARVKSPPAEDFAGGVSAMAVAKAVSSQEQAFSVYKTDLQSLIAAKTEHTRRRTAAQQAAQKAARYAAPPQAPTSRRNTKSAAAMTKDALARWRPQVRINK